MSGACSFCGGAVVRRRIGVERDLYACRDCGTEYQVGHVEPRLAERLEQARRARLVAGEREREGARDA